MANLLLLMGGSIACYKACAALSLLTQRGHTVKIAASQSALQFVGRATLEGLSGHEVRSEVFESGKMMDHIHLDRWADLMLLCPASAQTLNGLRAGLADTLPQALALAHDRDKPFLIAPAMNTQMLHHPATQESLRTLQEWGAELVLPGEGRLACGEVGAGRLAEPEQIVWAVEKRLAPSGLKVLMTAGGTEEPVDDVRAITNQSSGKTAATIADQLIAAGHEVLYVHGRRSLLPSAPCEKEPFTTTDDLKQALQRRLAEGFDVVICVAAVSDYTVSKRAGKISSDEPLTLELTPTEKLIDRVREWNSKECTLIGFKLTATQNLDERSEAVRNLKIRSGVDVVIHNDLQQIQEGHHPFTIYGDSVVQVIGEKALGERIESCYLQSTLAIH